VLPLAVTANSANPAKPMAESLQRSRLGLRETPPRDAANESCCEARRPRKPGRVCDPHRTLVASQFPQIATVVEPLHDLHPRRDCYLSVHARGYWFTPAWQPFREHPPPEPVQKEWPPRLNM
jgi:hypothetical protein